MNPDEIAAKILETLMSQSFVDWYEGRFMDYVEGDEGATTKEDMIADIKKKFYL